MWYQKLSIPPSHRLLGLVSFSLNTPRTQRHHVTSPDSQSHGYGSASLCSSTAAAVAAAAEAGLDAHRTRVSTEHFSRFYGMI